MEWDWEWGMGTRNGKYLKAGIFKMGYLQKRESLKAVVPVLFVANSAPIIRLNQCICQRRFGQRALQTPGKNRHPQQKAAPITTMLVAQQNGRRHRESPRSATSKRSWRWNRKMASMAVQT